MAKINELAELKALIAEQKKTIKSLESASSKENKSAGGVLIQAIDIDKKPVDNFIHYDKETERYQLKRGREHAHRFTKADAKEFNSEPGREHFIIVE